jgi:hypothetical protein
LEDRLLGYTTQATSIPCPGSNAAKQRYEEDNSANTNEQIDEPARKAQILY